MKTSLWPFAACAVVAAGLLQPAPAQAAAHGVVAREVGLAATVLTFEGGLAGIQPFLHFTPLQLGGSLCAAPNTCRPVNYPAWPLGQYFNNQGADRLQAALGGPAFEVVALSVDSGGLAVVQTFFKQIGIRHLHPYLDAEHDAMTLGGNGIPLTLLIDGQGHELGRKLGPAKWDDATVVELIRGLLPEQAQRRTQQP